MTAPETDAALSSRLFVNGACKHSKASAHLDEIEVRIGQVVDGQDFWRSPFAREKSCPGTRQEWP